MPKLSQEYNDDLVKSSGQQPAEVKNESKAFELPCSVCGKRLLVDEETFKIVNKALAQDLDNPLVCGDCEQAYVEEIFE